MNFFVTGNEIFKTGIDLKLITPKDSHGANFSADGQTLRQSFSIAQEIFSRAHGKIDFVLIGLQLDVFFRDENISADNLEKNLQTLTDYIKLCADCGAKPIGLILPFAPSVRESYREKFLTPLLKILAEFQKTYAFELINLFDLALTEEYFSDETHLNSGGTESTSIVLAMRLHKLKIFSGEDFRHMSYEFFFDLSYWSTVDFFHEFIEKIFRTTIVELRHKDKIKIAFVTDHAAVWCGDALYNLFAQSERFEPTIFFCRSSESTPQDFQHDVDQFKSHGLKVVAVFNPEEETPQQDVIIFLRPYHYMFSKSFQWTEMTPQTLVTCINYGFETTTIPQFHNLPVYHSAWKLFFDTELTRKVFDEGCKIGVPRAYVSGLPKMDAFFEPKKFSFPWKMTRPDAKKIIWAPHWSIDDAPECSEPYATFNYNFRFMYEFAKSHPETSWVVKPHPKLLESTIYVELFPSIEAFEAYLRAWDDLPNAQVFTGGYYQNIFATSDGMIHDSNSFIAEYQFTHKPMIFLTRDDNPPFTELGERILDVSYRVNGKDFAGISALIQKVFIDGDDPLKTARQKVFDELLNYRRINGMSASEFIFKSIVRELDV